MKFFKSKWFWILLIIVLVVGGLTYGKITGNNKGPQYEFAKVERGGLEQTVDATGIVQSSEKLDLHFESTGTVESVPIEEGKEVKAGTLLASLRLADLNASVAQAQANLDQKLAGSTEEDIRYYESAVAVAKADWDKAKADEASAIATAESALETAENNLKLAEGGEDSQIVQAGYEDAVALAYSSLTVLDDALTQADNILGIDNKLANDDFEDYLSIFNTDFLNNANSDYLATKLSRNAVRSEINQLNTNSGHDVVDQVLDNLKSALLDMNNLLGSVADVLSATSPIGDLTQTALNTKKTTIETSRSTVSAQFTLVVNQKQAIEDALNSYTTYSIAYAKAQRDLENTRLQYASLVSIKKASYDQAIVNLDKAQAPPREVDVAYYRAALAQAVANRNKAIIYAPIDGIITKINKKKGELALSSDVMIEMLSPHFEIEVDIPETDIIKLAVGDEVDITLDAFGDDEKFPGRVIAIDSASTEIQDVVYYQVKVALEDGKDQVRSGMTANVLVATEKKDDALYVPFRAVLSRNGSGQRYVRIVENGELKEIDVNIGLKGDGGLIEILSGVEEGQEVVLKIIEE